MISKDTIARLKEAIAKASPGDWHALPMFAGTKRDIIQLHKDDPGYCDKIVENCSNADSDLICLLRNHASALILGYEKMREALERISAMNTAGRSLHGLDADRMMALASTALTPPPSPTEETIQSTESHD